MTTCIWGGPLNAFSVWRKAVSREHGLQTLRGLEPKFFGLMRGCVYAWMRGWFNGGSLKFEVESVKPNLKMQK
jgi:hypothetical protein